MLGPRSGTLRKCVTVGLGFEILLLVAYKSVQSQQPSDQDVDHSDPSPAPCLPIRCYAIHHDDNELNLCTCQPAPVKCFPL